MPMPRTSFKMASSFWSEPTQCKPSKSWRSCASAAPGRRIAMITQLRKSSTQTSSSTSCSRTRRTRFTLRTDAEGFFARVVRSLNCLAPQVRRTSSEKRLRLLVDGDSKRDCGRRAEDHAKTREPLVGKIERLVHPDGRISWDYTTKMPLLDTRGRSSESAE